ncbi:MAG: undecaprenyldiphospho-muramoylpentapeptide beta-N-acetylglucosaminyltransferase [Clostridia bacterium]|nr:undecaprenyldiphospho-muramoylpentapeptide beta-N-acetylglucosaminyltransferase [Clostridia bacterium]
MRVLLAGGGTAGHINPAISIADTIKAKEPDSEFLFVGTKNGMESKLVPKSGYKIEFIEVSGFKRKLTVKNAVAVFKAVKAFAKCRKIIKKFRPDIVIGTGGYVSGPLLLAASKLKIPTLIHEQNVFAGLTSKMLSDKVNTVCISFEESRPKFEKAKNVVLTGNPLRNELFGLTYADARKKLGIDEKPFIVAFGGSLGAKRLNDSVVNYIKRIEDGKYNILFATGEREFDEVSKKLEGVKKTGTDVVKYIYNMNEAMQAADLLICRAGAITVSELNALGKPSVLIPSPNVTDNHQFYNAKALANKNAAVLIEEKDLDDDLFFNTVSKLAEDKVRLQKMSDCSKNMGIRDANELIYKEIRKIV